MVTTYFQRAKYIEKNIDKKNIGKTYWLRKVNIDIIIWENIFDRSADHK